MSNNSTIDFYIDEEGIVTSVVSGVAGPSCSRLADQYKSLGKKVKDKKTQDYFKPEITRQQNGTVKSR